MKKVKEIFIAFFAAFLLWSLATSQNKSESSYWVSLIIKKVPTEYIIKKPDIKLNIEVAGPKSLISKLNSLDFNAIYKMPETVKSGDFSFRIGPDDIQAPSGVEVRSVSPAVIRIILDKAETKLVKIKPEVIGIPADGYQVSKVELSPPDVNIRGPAETLQQISDIKTDIPFDVSGLNDTYRQKVALVLDDKSLSFVDNQFTFVTINIEPIIVTKRLDNIAITTDPIDVKTKLIPETFSADFRGPKNKIEEIIQPGIIAVIDIRDLKEEQSYLLTPFFRDLPPEIEVVDRNPKKITVKIITENDKKTEKGNEATKH
jgi:YbbR domain-containing protein